MQASATVETGINDHSVAKVVFTQNLGIDITVTGIAHAADVDVTQLAFGKLFHRRLVVFHPALVEQLVHGAMADGFHGLLP